MKQSPPVRTDILVVGAGPAGLHAAFYAGWRGLSVRILEAHSEVGGQPLTLYPDKIVYDVPGLPRIRAASLIERLVDQLGSLDVDIRTREVACTLSQDDKGDWVIGTSSQDYAAGAVILAAGMGALLPRKSQVPGTDVHPDVRTAWPDSSLPENVLIIGGVPQATRAALELYRDGASVTLTHRRAGFRGDPNTLKQLDAARHAEKIKVLAPATLHTLTPHGAQLIMQGELTHIKADTVLILNGYQSDLSPLLTWPLCWDGDYIPDSEGGKTALPGVYAVGDLAQSGGEFKLLSLAFAQAALAANHAAHHACPALRVRPGHSSDKIYPKRHL